MGGFNKKTKKENKRKREDFMDITKLNSVEACERGSWIEIKDFYGEPTGIKFKVIGIDSKKFKDQVNRLSRMNENSKVKSDNDKQEAETIRMLVSITMDWENVEDSEGKTIPFTKEAVQEVYENSPIISEQIIKFTSDRTNFLD